MKSDYNNLMPEEVLNTQKLRAPSFHEFHRKDSIEKIKLYENSLINVVKHNITFSEQGKKFCVVIASYNNENFVIPNIHSILIQTYSNWEIIYIDDASTDKTLEIANQIRTNWNIPTKRFRVLSHQYKQTSPAFSFYNAAHNYCDDNDIMIQLDGDDMLAGEKVLSKLAEIYENNNIWLTFGSFLSTGGTMRIDANKYNVPQIIDNVRKARWITSHLRTSYTWLFKKIKVDDLKYENKFLNCTTDLAIMLPMIEMAGKERVYYIKDIIHLYRLHPNNVFIKARNFQINMENYIRTKPSYPLLPYSYPFNNSIDKIYVINLEQAYQRWNITSNLLSKENITHHRFNATYGYDVKIIDLQSNDVFYGTHLKDKLKKIELGKKYKIICDPSDKNSLEFNFRGYTNYDKSTISAGEIGCWCSIRRILEDIYINNYNKVIIFEDDIVPVKNFNFHLQNFLNYLPEKFDIGYLAVSLAKNIKDPFYAVNDYVNGLNNHTRGWGSFGFIITKEAVNKLRSFDEFSFPTDVFYWCLSNASMPIIHHTQYCQKLRGTLDNYISSKRLVEVRRIMDEHCINNMGRNQTKIELKTPQKIYFISNNSELLQKVEIGIKAVNCSYFPILNEQITAENNSYLQNVTCSSPAVFKLPCDPLKHFSSFENMRKACSLTRIFNDAQKNNLTNFFIVKSDSSFSAKNYATEIHNLIEYTDNLGYFDHNFNNIDNAPYFGVIIKGFNYISGDLTDFSNFICNS